ncbi:MAG: hypothetical protein IPQ09_15865 [Myxococcales bacterium]|nr:hypothetical protein [Myxococcales bacterium]
MRSFSSRLPSLALALALTLPSLHLAACSDTPATPGDGGTVTETEAGTPPPGEDGGPGPDTAPPPPGSTADSKFRPSPNGFSFSNSFSPTEPTPGPTMGVEDVRRMFGDVVCGSTAGGCVLTPAAQQWLEAANKDLYQGLCEGFAILANILYVGANGMKASDFQPGATNPFELKVEGNGKLQRELAYWYTTQTLYERTPGLTPAELGAQLFAALGKTPSADLPTLAFFKKDGKGGHAMNAHSIAATPTGFDVKIYDNNYPNEERTLTIDTKKDEWRYVGSTTAQGEKDEYIGDATSKSIHLIPTALRLRKFDCTFCGNVQPGAPPTGVRQIRLNSGGHALITDPAGKRLGYANGALVNEIAGAKARTVLNGSRGRPDPEPTYELPAGTDTTITVDGAGLTAESKSTLTVVGSGYTVDVEDIALSPGQKDTIVVRASGTVMEYTTQQAETPTLIVGIQTATDDYLIEIHVSSDTNGQTVKLELDQANGRLKVTVDGHDTGDYDLDVVVHRIGASGEEMFEHEGDTGINIPSGGTASIAYGAWTGNGGTIALEIDDERNGSVDRTVVLTDQK